eukprot:TRINITY_DN8903_c0_g1_i2.p1 TRINITY_DN8903_c0_g1~~TRINITY_DN8903_c0_g1_i2.p1  ORF type:complete len:449 (+),score=128.46 TRINITY_DN8903_c0_g1_i2:114-1460(+)
MQAKGTHAGDATTRAIPSLTVEGEEDTAASATAPPPADASHEDAEAEPDTELELIEPPLDSADHPQHGIESAPALMVVPSPGTSTGPQLDGGEDVGEMPPPSMRKRSAAMAALKEELEGKRALKFKKRSDTAHELLKIERSYVEKLSIMCEVFVDPLEEASTSDEPILTYTQLMDIFSCVKMIRKMNAEFLERLESLMNTWSEETCIGPLLSTMGFLRDYSAYINTYGNALKVYTNLSRECKPFKEYLSKPHVRKAMKRDDLSSYLIMPIQQIPRYEMLAKQLLKYTPTEHSDYAPLEEASALIHTIAEEMNEAKKKFDNVSKMFDVSSRFEPHCAPMILTENREYILEGFLFSRSRYISDSPPRKSLYFFLCNDVLLKAKTRHNFGEDDTLPDLDFVRMVPTEELKFHNTEEYPLAFRIGKDLWYCQSKYKKKLWLKGLASAGVAEW